MKDTSENYRALRQRIAAANDTKTLERLEASATRVYNAGQLSPAELKRLDVFVMEKTARLSA